MGLYAAAFDFGCLKITISLESNRQAKQAAFASDGSQERKRGERPWSRATRSRPLASIGCPGDVLFNANVKTDRQMLNFSFTRMQITDNSQHKYNKIQYFLRWKRFKPSQVWMLRSCLVLNKALNRNKKKHSCSDPLIKETALEDVCNLISATLSLFISILD